MVSDKRARPSNALNQSTAIEDKRQILSIAQDIIHCNSKGRVKLPKHTSLAICVHHLTTSKRLIELLNRMGHCVSYDEMRAVNTSIAEDVLAKAEEFGSVIPTVIKAGSFVQIAADNNDLNEETRREEYYAGNHHGYLSEKNLWSRSTSQPSRTETKATFITGNGYGVRHRTVSSSRKTSSCN